MLNHTQADQVASLLNSRNQLTIIYDRQRVLEHANEYLFRCGSSGEVIACVQLKRVQWYQGEVLHLTVAASAEGKGHAKALLAEVVQEAQKNNIRLLQCTIREGNQASSGLFKQAGFVHTSTFHNVSSGNNVLVLQRVVASAA